MKFITIIFAAICRIGVEYSFPFLVTIFFSWHVYVPVLTAFVTWQILSAVYLAPMYKKQMDEQKQSDINFAVDRAMRYYRLELIGRLPANERVEIDEKVQKALKPAEDTATLDS